MLGIKTIPLANTLHLSKTPINQGFFLFQTERSVVLHCYKAMSHRVATKQAYPEEPRASHFSEEYLSAYSNQQQYENAGDALTLAFLRGKIS